MAHQPTFGTFGNRFGYVRWLLLLGRDELPGFAEIGRAVGRTGQAVSAWMRAKEAPPGTLEFYDGLAEYFGVDMRWLVKGQGEPPEPALWSIWREYRDRRATAELTPTERGGTKATPEVVEHHRAIAKAVRQQGKAKKKRNRSA